MSLHGHENGVWALAAYRDDLASASTDRTVRMGLDNWSLLEVGYWCPEATIALSASGT